MEGISSFRNEIEIPFIFNVSRQRTTDFGYAFFSRRDAEESRVHYSFLRRVNACSFLWLH
jgi:hypothetical protein